MVRLPYRGSGFFFKMEQIIRFDGVYSLSSLQPKLPGVLCWPGSGEDFSYIRFLKADRGPSSVLHKPLNSSPLSSLPFPDTQCVQE